MIDWRSWERYGLKLSELQAALRQLGIVWIGGGLIGLYAAVATGLDGGYDGLGVMRWRFVALRCGLIEVPHSAED